jgi:hypothetical protein
MLFFEGEEMEYGSLGEAARPWNVASDGGVNGVLAVATAEDEDEDTFLPIYDAPFITLNRVDGEHIAEVIMCGNPCTDLDRIQSCLDVGKQLGLTPYARVHGEYSNVLIYFHQQAGAV